MTKGALLAILSLAFGKNFIFREKKNNSKDPTSVLLPSELTDRLFARATELKASSFSEEPNQDAILEK